MSQLLHRPRHVIHNLPVEYGLTIEEMARRTKIRDVDPELNSRNFKPRKAEIVRRRIVLVCPGEETSMRDARQFRQDGLEFAHLEDMMAIAARGLDINLPVVALGSIWNNGSGHDFAPGLTNSFTGSIALELGDLDETFRRETYFALARTELSRPKA